MPAPDAQPPRIYADLADWFHLLTPPGDYAEEAAAYHAALTGAASGPVKTLLELGSGGGNNASHLKRDFTMTLTDLSEAMLAVSRRINPELEHVQNDMRTLRLGRTFDAVFAHDATCYLLDEESVRAAVGTAWVHVRPGGVVLFAPDAFAENWRVSHDTGGSDAPDGRGLRYVEWTHRVGVEAPLYAYDLAYLLREADGNVQAVLDRHICAAHPQAVWVAALTGAGFVDITFHELLFTEDDGWRYTYLVARRPD